MQWFIAVCVWTVCRSSNLDGRYPCEQHESDGIRNRPVASRERMGAAVERVVRPRADRPVDGMVRIGSAELAGVRANAECMGRIWRSAGFVVEPAPAVRAFHPQQAHWPGGKHPVDPGWYRMVRAAICPNSSIRYGRRRATA